jgi:hypothetical protein
MGHKQFKTTAQSPDANGDNKLEKNKRHLGPLKPKISRYITKWYCFVSLLDHMWPQWMVMLPLVTYKWLFLLLAPEGFRFPAPG